MALMIADHKPIGLAVRSYQPFLPDAGILCGGYQGLLYPQPTSFYLPDGDVQFEIVEYQRPDADTFAMATGGDFYVGLGKANPSINYRNPGHLVGLMDTIGRMAYGLSVIASCQQGVYEGEIEPVVTMTIPLTKFKDDDGDTLGEETEITFDDFYPNWSEIPSNYIDGMIDDDGIPILKPYIDQPFEYNEAEMYVPTAENPVDLAPFRDAATWESFLDMQTIFRQAFTELSDFCENTFEDEIEHELAQDALCKEGTLFDDVPKPLMKSGDDADDWPEPDGTGEAYVDMPEWAWNQPFFKQWCAPLSTGAALQLMYGDPEVHDGPGVQHIYRTFHEMNAVVNVLPIQIYGISYSRFQEYEEISRAIEIGTHEWHGAWIICDIIFTTNLATNFQLNGTASFEYIIDEEGIPEYFTIVRDAKVITSVTNKFIWNRAWYAFQQSNEIDASTEESIWMSTDLWTNHSSFDEGVGGIEPFSDHKPSFEENTEFVLNGDVSTDGTGQTVRIRIIVQSQMLRIDGDFDHADKVTLDFTLSGAGQSELEISKTFELRGE